MAWQVTALRRHLVCASRIIQAGNALFIGKDEAYIMNRRKKEKSMLRKEGNVYVLDVLVKVPSGVVPPTVYKPRGGRRNQPGYKRERTEERVRFDLMAGQVCVEGWSRRIETVSPQHDEHCGCQFECDSVFECEKATGATLS